jgi:hypothetical protein
MRGLFTSKTLRIDTGHAVSGIADRAQTLRIQSGRVWITVEGIQHDYFLHAGDSFTAVPGRLTVVEADQEARIDVRRPAAKHALRTIGQWLLVKAQQLPKGDAVQTSLKRHRTCDAC